jgi:hypothetical protein
VFQVNQPLNLLSLSVNYEHGWLEKDTKGLSTELSSQPELKVNGLVRLPPDVFLVRD